MKKVLVVDDHEVEGIGRAEAVRRAGHSATYLSWNRLIETSATNAVPEGEGFDLVLAVVRRDVTRWDRYWVLGAVGDLSGRFGATTRIVAGVPGSRRAHPALVMRLEAAGALELVNLADLVSIGQMEGLLDRPARGCHPERAELAITGLDASGQPSLVIDFLTSQAKSRPEVLEAFRPELAQNQLGLSRRQVHTLRRKVCALGGLHAGNGISAGGPPRDTSLARWSRVVDFVNACRGWSPEDELELPTALVA